MTIPIKTCGELDLMRESCRIAGEVRNRLAEAAKPGTTTAELDGCAADLIREHAVESAFLGYRGYPGNVCISLNEEVVHGIPDDRRIQVGDIVSIDVGIRKSGFIGDTATTVMVGVTDIDTIRLVKITEEALRAATTQALEGNRLSDISHAVESTVTGAGFSVVRDFVGHGVGKELHEEPQIPNFGKPHRGPVLKYGMTFAIEPMVNMGGSAVEIAENGWTVKTVDRQPSAHFEHTVLIGGKNGAEILT